MQNAYLEIPTYVLPTIQKQIEKLNRKARRLDCQTASIVEGPIYAREIYRQYIVDGEFGAEAVPADAPTIVQFTTIMITYPEVRVAGWNYLAKIEHTENGNLLYSMSDSPLPEKYRTSESGCDHCGITRRRNDTFVVTNGTEYKQVGSTCVRSFCGLPVTQIMANAAFFTFVQDCRDRDYDDEGWGGGNCHYTPTFRAIDFLTHACCSARLQGYMSRKNAVMGDAVTCDSTMNSLDPPKGEAGLPIETRDRLRALKIIGWVWTQNSSSDWMYNLQTLLRNDAVTGSQAGLMASALPAYSKAMEKPVVGATRPQSAWQGTVKERKPFTDLTVKRISPFTTDYGTSAFVSFEDTDGNQLKWCTQNFTQFEEGDVVTSLMGTIKALDEWHGIKQTTITRCSKIVMAS